MREIKFRGKSKNGVWVYGSLIKMIRINIETHILPFTGVYDDSKILDLSIKVVPQTTGQFTELKDINGIEIYEGDICKIYFNYCSDKIGVVYFENGCFYVDDKHPSGNLPLKSFREGEDNTLEVIGNIHDNPELLQS
ncbi:YopX family protein [Dysgonomonas massiliensis]|uniref:YopX family protein n=1 Tax=Dysgonomonas massiliensis TaxID=2040292 RepID=UPI000C78EB08|nr:YopX family protein [Dysgonomonas massiliensis]